MKKMMNFLIVIIMCFTLVGCGKEVKKLTEEEKIKIAEENTRLVLNELKKLYKENNVKIENLKDLEFNFKILGGTTEYFVEGDGSYMILIKDLELEDYICNSTFMEITCIKK